LLDIKEDGMRSTTKGARIAAAVHRRILEFLNSASRPADLMYLPHDINDLRIADRGLRGPDGRRRLIDEDVAKDILEVRDHAGPYGFMNVDQMVIEAEGIVDEYLDDLIEGFGEQALGVWQSLPYNTQQPSGSSVDVAHAAMLHTGKVLFIPADYQNQGWPTPIWDPSDEVNPQFEYPLTNPDYALFCGGHSFLSDGRLLVVGGGGDRGVSDARWGFLFDPVERKWTRTAGAMSEYRWYPTAVTLGDRRVLVTCGNGSGNMQTYIEKTGHFADISGDTESFPHLYPGLHLLPDHRIFYSRTGWGSAGADTVGAHDSSGYYEFQAPVAGSQDGTWQGITPSYVHRAKGMSVTLLEPNRVRVLVVGGAYNDDTYELIDVTNLSPASSWNPPTPMPDGQGRRQCNAVLLPDGTVFLSGGLSPQFGISALFDPATDKWSQMAPLPKGRVRQYHSFAILLPSAKVLSAGGDNHPEMEIFSPPYLFRGQRPVIRGCPTEVAHGSTFTVLTPDEPSITSVVLVRPMAVTHQTDTEQRVISLAFTHGPGTHELSVTAPGADYPHSRVPPGYYMLFILNAKGVPSVASWTRLASPTVLKVLERTPIACHKRHDDHMELWLVDAFGVVRGNWWNGDWHEWYSLPNATLFPPRGHVGALGRHEDHMEIFAIAEDGRLHHNWWDGEWHGWNSLGTPNIVGVGGGPPLIPGSPLAVRSRFSDHMEVWVVGADGQVHGIWWDGNWRDWFVIPGASFPPGAPLASHSRHDDHMEIWGIDAQGTLRGNWWDGNWHTWYALPTPDNFHLQPGGNLAMLGRNEDHMELWSVGTDDRLHGIWWDGDWRSWYTLDGPFSFAAGAPLGANSRHEDYMDLWAVGDDNVLHGIWWDGDWQQWYSLGQIQIPRATPPTALSRNDDHMEVWAAAPVNAGQTDFKVHGVWWDGNWNPFYRLD
jgi:hypothetical protein